MQQAVTSYRVTLRFCPGGPAVTAEWAEDEPAFERYSKWIGLYGSQPEVTVRLDEVAHEHEQVLKTWPQAGDFVQ